MTAVLIAPASLFVAAFAPFLDVSEKVRSSALGGMFMGLAGVALLVGVESVHSLGEFLGSLAMIGAAAVLRALELRGQALQGPDLGTTSLISIAVASRADAARARSPPRPPRSPGCARCSPSRRSA